MKGTTLSKSLKAALELPNGARFFRCALQVNPYTYLTRHKKKTPFNSESEYNAAIIEVCSDLGVEVIGVTDHYRVADSLSLIAAARAAGIFAFSGFEAVSKDGVHYLCLFDPEKDRMIERFIGECGVHDSDIESPPGALDSTELLVQAKAWGAVCVAAHVAGEGGLLRKLSGKSRANVWKSRDLLACALPGAVDDAPEGLRQILQNKDAQHLRERPIAIVNASDVNDPEDLRKAGATCFIKMSSVSVEALRQAFLDPDSRIRLNSAPQPEPHAEFVALTWEGGFLSDTALHLNSNLNVLIGGRGTGKSTIIESIRYVLGLEPLGDEARKAHEGVVRFVLRAGTKISLLVRSHKPAERWYTIERAVPNPPVVKDETGAVLALLPKDVVPGVEVFGQHEISELTKSKDKLTLLLDRFIDRDLSIGSRKAKIRLELENSRSRIVGVHRELRMLEERLSMLPALEETHKRFKEAGLESKLKERSLLVREERVFVNIEERLEPFRELNRELSSMLPIDSAFVSQKAIGELPNGALLRKIEGVLGNLGAEISAGAKQLSAALTKAEKDIAAIKAQWQEKRKAIDETYEKLLRELQKSKIDGAEFIRLRNQIEELRPLREKKDKLSKDVNSHEAYRRQLLAEWEDLKAAEYREFQNAAKKVSRKLKDRVRVEVTMAGNREPLELLLREMGGNLSAAIDRVRSTPNLSLQDFASKCREGKDSLMKSYGIPSGSSERIAQGDRELFLRIEELDLPATTDIELNTAPDDESPQWQSLESLSTGQKATAILLLLLLESEAPLVVDQPEDDLDNRFITDGVVPLMRLEKRRRQFLFSTHNANIPVLGDAELIVGLAASGDAREGQAKISKEHMGSIDSRPVRELVEEILEGGKDAFEMRRSKYGF